MADEPDPPRKQYGFKDREFKRDNRPASASQPPMPTARDLAKLAGPVTRSTPVKSGPKTEDPNDVFTTLQQNRAAEMKSGEDAVEIVKTRSRRKRDYWLIMTVGNLAILAPALILGANPMTLGFAAGGMILYSMGVTWIMWQVMGKY